MPFRSQAQKEYMHKNLPEIAARWEKETISDNLPKRLHPKKKKPSLITQRRRSRLIKKRS
jgi:hypothetical protein|tara:strand:+ start:1651 stop:1830 length:180 start_codon:yes stop_codon:yes gene_type:complete